MPKTLKELVPEIEAWPEADQAELAEYARDIQARRAGIYVMTDAERVAVGEALAQVERGELVPDEEMRALWSRYGIA
jgi:hypothetical protein